MTTWDRHLRDEKPQQRRKEPSFSSSLLDAIYHSIDETKGEERRKHNFSRRDDALRAEEEITSIRKAIMIEKWMENYARFTKSGSGQNNSTTFSLPATGSTPKSSALAARRLKNSYKLSTDETSPRCQGRFTRTKSRALKIYGDLKKAKQPISPGRKIASFLNSIFSSRNMKKHHSQAMEDWSNSLRKSTSVKESTTCSFTSRSCLSKAPLPRSKTKRSVTFGPVNYVIAGEDHPNLNSSMPNISSHFIVENINSLRNHEDTKPKIYEYYDDEDDDDDDDDDESCTSSDLFELENISIVGNGMHKEELPVYGSTSLKINQAIAIGLFV